MVFSEETAEEAKIRTGRRYSLVWLVPVLALIVGGWLAYRAIIEHGPQITIHLESAEGLVAGKTKIKFNELTVGTVEDIQLNDDLSGVEIIARLDPQMRPYLKSDTNFWVVKARIDAGKISGLQTLLAGAYIAMNPASGGAKAREFIGLDKPPALASDAPGKIYHLSAANLGSLNVGSPIFFRKIRVGQVIDYRLIEDGSAVYIDFFIESPYDRWVKTDTRFWNASGIQVRLDAQGVSVQTESLTSIFLGGLAFESPVGLVASEEAPADHSFLLYANRETADKKVYTEKVHLLMYFPQSVRGLKVGAPVDFGGMQLGSVVDVQMFLDIDNLQMKIPVLVALEPERMRTYSDGNAVSPEIFVEMNSRYAGSPHPIIEALVDNGLRATLKTGNLLTGQLYVSLDILKDTPDAHLTYGDKYPVFPTVTASLDKITENISRLVKKLNDLPLEGMVEGVNRNLAELERTLAGLRTAMATVDRTVLPKISSSLQRLDVTLSGINRIAGPDSGLDARLRQILDDLNSTVRSMRGLAESLDRKPESLIFGKGEK